MHARTSDGTDDVNDKDDRVDVPASFQLYESLTYICTYV